SQDSLPFRWHILNSGKSVGVFLLERSLACMRGWNWVSTCEWACWWVGGRV
ncbi:hypothetical protein M405DRAFT_804800, partial [Rhizopogon salebrosus TDB-379]